MNRRTFFASIAAAFVADPDSALWVPGRKVYSIPPAAVIEPPITVFYPTRISVQALILLERNLVFNRQECRQILGRAGDSVTVSRGERVPFLQTGVSGSDRSIAE